MAVAGLEPVVVAVMVMAIWMGAVFLRQVLMAPVRAGLAEWGGMSAGGYCISRMVGGLDKLNGCGWHIVANQGCCANDRFRGGDPLWVANHLDDIDWHGL